MYKKSDVGRGGASAVVGREGPERWAGGVGQVGRGGATGGAERGAGKVCQRQFCIVWSIH